MKEFINLKLKLKDTDEINSDIKKEVFRIFKDDKNKEELKKLDRLLTKLSDIYQSTRGFIAIKDFDSIWKSLNYLMDKEIDYKKGLAKIFNQTDVSNDLPLKDYYFEKHNIYSYFRIKVFEKLTDQFIELYNEAQNIYSEDKQKGKELECQADVIINKFTRLMGKYNNSKEPYERLLYEDVVYSFLEIKNMTKDFFK
ncbi:MAG: hypothetical protein ACXAC7_09920 [Candidatus Hodarchaeales archaeon]|jgi:hypothetical protein